MNPDIAWPLLLKSLWKQAALKIGGRVNNTKVKITVAKDMAVVYQIVQGAQPKKILHLLDAVSKK